VADKTIDFDQKSVVNERYASVGLYTKEGGRGGCMNIYVLKMCQDLF
jgi:hypothetical protein